MLDEMLGARRLIKRLRFSHLQLLVELARAGSLRAAAVSLNLTQPALSKSLHEIEQSFGFELFTRSARGLAATERGNVVIRGAGRLLTELAHVRLESASEQAVTVLRVGAPPFIAQGYLPGVFARALGPEGRLRIQLVEERVPQITQMLLEGTLDALVTSYPTDLAEDEGCQLRYEKLFDAEFAVIAPVDHPLASAREAKWHQLAGQHWVLSAKTTMLRRMVDDVFRNKGLPTPVPVIESRSPVTNCRLVAKGVGLSVVPAAVLEGEPSGAFTRLRVEPPVLSAPVALIYRAEPESPRVDSLRKMLYPLSARADG